MKKTPSVLKITMSNATNTRGGMGGFAVSVGVLAYSRRRKLATAAAAALAILLGYHVIFGQNGITAYQQKRKDTRDLDLQLQTLTKQNEQLRGHVERLQSDPNAIEHEAREELHYTRPGEVIYTLPAPKHN